MHLVKSYKLWSASVCAAVLFGLAGCEQPPEEKKEAVTLRYKSVAWSTLDGWDASQAQGLVEGFGQSCRVFAKKEPTHNVHKNPLFGTYGAWQSICRNFQTKEKGDIKALFESAFEVKEVISDEGSLFTGYYEPLVDGSLEKEKGYTTPLYRIPSDILVANLGDFDEKLKGKRIVARADGRRLIPYYTRADFEAQAREDDVLLWLKDPVEAFFLHIQGSGWVRLPSGRELHVAYAENNGRPYHAIGRTLMKQGHLTRDNVSLESIKAWAQNNPNARDAVFNTNPRYIFFRLSDGQTKGAFGTPLYPERSLAIDPNHIPLGVPLLVNTRLTSQEDAPFFRAMMAHDTGAAITGPVRGDIYFGKGKQAEKNAGFQNSSGRLYVLVPR